MKIEKVEILAGDSGFCVKETEYVGVLEVNRRHYFSTIHEATHWIVEAFSEPREPVTNPEKKET